MRDNDNNRVYTRPTAWRKFKELFGTQNHIAELAIEIEKFAGEGCPRFYLAVAMCQLLALKGEERAKAVWQFGEWCTQRDYDRQFRKVMQRIGFTDDDTGKAVQHDA